MFNNGHTTLKFCKKRNQWENSTQSCTIAVNENENEKELVKGYSYREVIFYYDNDFKSWIFNDYKFSNTTSSHQSELWSRIKKIAAENNIITTRSYSINNGFNYDKLQQTELNINLVAKYFPEKLEAFKAKLEQNEIDRKKSISTNSMIKKIQALNYSTKKGLLAAMEKCNYKLSNIRINTTSDALKALSLGFTTNEIKTNFNTTFNNIRLNIHDLIRIKENDQLKELFNLGELEKNNRIDFTMYIYEAPRNSDDFFKSLDKMGILEKVINKTFNDNDLDSYASGRALKEYLAKKSLSDITN